VDSELPPHWLSASLFTTYVAPHPVNTVIPRVIPHEETIVVVIVVLVASTATRKQISTKVTSAGTCAKAIALLA